MKKLSLLLILLFPILANAQYKEYTAQWHKVENFEYKKLPKSALAEVEKIYKKAKRSNNVPQQIKCFMYQAKFAMVLEEDAQLKIINRLKASIIKSKTPTTNVLESLLAELYSQYYLQNSWKIRERTKTTKLQSDDFRTWDLENFYLVIHKHYQNSLQHKEQLQNAQIESYNAIIATGNLRKFRPTLYDFLAHRALIFYSNSAIELPQPSYRFEMDNINYLADVDTFLKQKITTKDTFSKRYNALLIYQAVLQFHKDTHNDAALLYLDLERLRFVKYRLNLANDKIRTAYRETLYYTINKYSNTDAVSLAQYELASDYHTTGISNEKGTKWDIKKAFEIASETSLQHPDTFGALKCKGLINTIIAKELHFQLETYVPINKPSYTKVDFKNVKQVYFNIYKPTRKQLEGLYDSDYYKYSDSLSSKKQKLRYINTFDRVKSWEQATTDIGDYRKHSTEMVLPALDFGKYIIVVSYESVDTKDCHYEIQEYQVTNLTLVKSTDKEQQVMQVLDRVTGKPIPNAAISFELEHYKKPTKVMHVGTNGDGYAYFKRPKGYYSSCRNIEISTDTDFATFDFASNRGIYKPKKEVHTDRNMYLFTDRAIYRPGQKVYFKGILTKTRDLNTTVLAKKKVAVTLYDTNRQKVKTIDLETTDFGSFFGEFNLPADGLNGRFRIEATVDFLVGNDIYQSTYIQVEEYKRPKFEAEFKQVEQSYRVNDTVHVSGTATAFSGAKITDAKVTYRVKRNVNFPAWYWWYRPSNPYNTESQEITHGETTTDADGVFKIDFKALPDTSVDKAGMPVFNYEISADITDVNGETHSTTTTVHVGYHSMKASVLIANMLDKNKTDNELEISTKNLNGADVSASGTLKIYKLQAPENVLRPRPWAAPDFPLLSKSAFKALFPNDPYDNESEINNWKDGKLVFESDFKTEKEAAKIALTNTQSWQSGKYHIVLETKDRFDNVVKEELRFDVFGTDDTTLADHKLFEIKKDKASYKPYEEVRLDFGSASNDFWLNVWIEKKHYLSKQSYHLTDSKKTIQIPITDEDRGGFTIHYYWTNKNTSKSGHIYIAVPYEEHSLTIATKTFRDKLLPGQDETWEFIIKGNKGEKVAAEMLANMYDASLDDIVSGNSYWMNPLYRPNFNWNRSFELNQSFNINTLYVSYDNMRVSYPGMLEDTMNWYGFSFTDNYYVRRSYQRTLAQRSYIRKGSGMAQRIYGTVSDDMGPIPGVDVTIQGTDISTVTDFDGKYSINAKIGDVLIFTMAGSRTEKKVGNINQIDAVLEMQELEEVVVTAMGVKNHSRSASYASQMLKTEELMIDGDGAAGKVYLRGASSVKPDSKALYIVDGVVVDADKIDMNNVASINVLKGPAAVSLYGLRAANGAIVITTKNGLSVSNKQISPEEQALLAKVKARKNFNETAFFLPTLRTNSKGEVRFSFTMPEALTTWKLQLLAHTKDLKVGTQTLSTITQKDLMVVPNTPRFLREGDSIVISSKIANLTDKAGTGFAQLMLSDALTGKSLDNALNNSNATKNFSVKAKGNTAVSWKLYIPKGTASVQWKVVAKMGDFTDGEQNALPVLTNRMLVTESLPMWVRGKQSKTFSLDKLIKNESPTAVNHKLTLEITSNPAWYAVQALPYLMEYPHECAEQTFSRYYANALATHITNSNPKVKAVFEQWENTDAMLSNLEKNQALKSIVIAETPWLRDAQSEDEQRKRMGLLFNLTKMSRELKRAANKLSHIQKSSGGFPWFKGGRYESRYITQHIASGFGHLKHLGVKTYSPKIDNMLDKAVTYLDKEFAQDYHYLLEHSHRIVQDAKAKDKAQAKLDSVTYLEANHLGNFQIQYLYMRSFYKDKTIHKTLDKAITYYTNQAVEYWKDQSIYTQGMIALFLNRNTRGEYNSVAKAIVNSLEENSITSEEMGMYWKSNRGGYYWYQAPIETQALLIEAFSEIAKDLTKVDNLKLWLLKNKQTSQWRTTKATTEAIYALLLNGTDWLAIDENVQIKLGNKTIDPAKLADVKLEAGTGYFKKSWNAEEIKPEMGKVTLSKKEAGVAWGALYWQYFEDLDKITFAKTPLQLTKDVFLKKNTDTGEEITKVTDGMKLHVGDLLRIRIELKVDRDMEFIHMKDMRAAGLEPVDVVSTYKWQDGLGYYQSTKDASTNFFISSLRKGNYVFEYDLRVNNAGDFSNGITTIQSMYAPEFSSHSKGVRIKVEE